MAQLRLIVGAASHGVLAAATLLATTACRASEASPSSGLTPPAGWKALPELATAVTDAAKQTSITVDGVEAWGDPARGCYAAWLALRAASGAPAAIADPMLASLSAELPGLTVNDVVKPDPKVTDAGVLSLSFTRPPYRGKLRAPIAKTGAIGVLACFWNVREPVACEAACNQLMGSFK